jgi:hypothetical protein
MFELVIIYPVFHKDSKIWLPIIVPIVAKKL